MKLLTDIWRVIRTGLLIATVSTSVFALKNDLKLAQFDHSAWGPNEGVPPHIEAFAQTADDYLWIGSGDGLFQFDGLRFERYQPQSGPPLPADAVVSLLALPNGDLWIGFYSGAISLLRNGHAVNYGSRDGVPAKTVLCLAQDSSGTIWASSDNGLARLENNQWKTIGREWNFSGKSARALYLDRAGTLWVATENTIVFLPKGSRKFQATGIKVGIVLQIAQALNGRLWMAETTRSVRPVPLHTKLAPSDETEIRVGSREILFTSDGDFWITTLGDGLLRVSDPEKLTGKPDRFSNSLDSYTVEEGLSNKVDTSIFQDRAGNIWVGTFTGVDRFRKTPLNSIKGLSRNPQPQPPSVQSIVADGQSYTRPNALKLPAGTKNLQINYTAADLASPILLHFKYKLDRVDAQWQDAGPRRTAFYTNLGPGKYRFHLMASNALLGWNSNDTVTNFTIPAFWFQTVWFQALCGAVLLLLLWTLYQFRLRQLERQFNLAIEARVNERERIARDLHDTFFQGIQGLLLRFHTATSQLSKDEPARRIFEETLQLSDQVMLEGRELVLDLRAATSELNDLPAAFADFGKEMQEDSSCEFKLVVNGFVHPLHPVVFEELFKIGKEALGNAFRHSGAHSIETELNYERYELRIQVRDDGAGIDSTILRQGHRDGHFGLPGMRERAQKIGAHLDVWSRNGAGTEVELRIAARVAYVSQPSGSRLWKLRRLWQEMKQAG
jgi:signal transduction histidine kinase